MDASHYVAYDFLEVLGEGCPRRLATHHLDHQTAQTPNICRDSVSDPPEDFWGHVVGCSLEGVAKTGDVLVG